MIQTKERTTKTRRISHCTTLFRNRGMIPLLYTDRKKQMRNKWKSRLRRWNNSK